MAVLAGLGLILIALGVLILGVGGIGIVGVGIGIVLVIHDWHLLYLCKGSMSRKNTPYSQKISKKLVDRLDKKNYYKDNKNIRRIRDDDYRKHERII